MSASCRAMPCVRVFGTLLDDRRGRRGDVGGSCGMPAASVRAASAMSADRGSAPAAIARIIAGRRRTPPSRGALVLQRSLRRGLMRLPTGAETGLGRSGRTGFRLDPESRGRAELAHERVGVEQHLVLWRRRRRRARGVQDHIELGIARPPHRAPVATAPRRHQPTVAASKSARPVSRSIAAPTAAEIGCSARPFSRTCRTDLPYPSRKHSASGWDAHAARSASTPG